MKMVETDFLLLFWKLEPPKRLSMACPFNTFLDKIKKWDVSCNYQSFPSAINPPYRRLCIRSWSRCSVLKFDKKYVLYVYNSGTRLMFYFLWTLAAIALPSIKEGKFEAYVLSIPYVNKKVIFMTLKAFFVHFVKKLPTQSNVLIPHMQCY